MFPPVAMAVELEEAWDIYFLLKIITNPTMQARITPPTIASLTRLEVVCAAFACACVAAAPAWALVSAV
jgi:hypothetical protein